MKDLTIGKLAKRAGVSTDTVRFYERCGLLQPPERTASNYRVYPEKEVQRLQFIVRAKNLGFTLNEIKDLLSLRGDPNATKGQVKALAETKIADLQERIAEMQKILESLIRITETCSGEGLADDCPILAAMEGGERHPCLHADHEESCFDHHSSETSSSGG